MISLDALAMTDEPRFHVCSIGNAIIDVLTEAPETAVEEFGLNKGSMTLIDEDRANYLTSVMLKRVEESGGSAGNTAVGLAGLGARSAYIGKVRKDVMGMAFSESMRRSNVYFHTTMAESGPSTARCLIFVTPDHQRTMNTYLGACVQLTPHDIDPEIIENSSVTYLEGYLWDLEEAKAAFRKAIKIAHASGRKVALSLSDPFCVQRYRHEFRDLIENNVDILFANSDEISTLYECEYEQAREKLRGKVEIAALTMGVKGSEIVTSSATIPCPIIPIKNRVDTTGAGDFFAAGFLYGLVQERDLQSCAILGSASAAAVIQVFGARLSSQDLAWVKSVA